MHFLEEKRDEVAEWVDRNAIRIEDFLGSDNLNAQLVREWVAAYGLRAGGLQLTCAQNQ